VEVRRLRWKEEGPERETWLWRPPAATRESPVVEIAERKPGAAAISGRLSRAGPPRTGRIAGISTSVTGSLFYLDRIFDLQGYTGSTRTLPLRHVRIELVRALDDSVVAVSATGADGSYQFTFGLDTPTDLKLRLVSRVEGLPGVTARVLDQAPPGGDLSGSVELVREVIQLSSLGPGAVVDLGVITLTDSQSGDTLPAFNLLDCLLDAEELLETPGWIASPVALPPMIWSPTNPQPETLYQDGVVRVASPGGGDDDSWADAVVLAALGHWFLATYSRVDQWSGFADLASTSDPRRALGDGAALVFAALVRSSRSHARLDRDGAPADSLVSVFVDLGFPPPLGFPGLAQDGLDLETREQSHGFFAPPRGQLSVANVAAMLWDLVDDTATLDGTAGDDDPRQDPAADGGARFYQLMTQDLPALPATEAVTYEDLHEAWRARWGEDAALDSIAVQVGRTALFTDAFEVDDLPAQAVPMAPWHQPAPQAGAGVVLGELFLGDADWVEITNPSTTPVALGGWKVVVRRNGFSTGVEREAVVPAGFVLRPGRSVVLHEGGNPADDSFFDLFFPTWNIPWQEGSNGACLLVDDLGTVVDFLRWDGWDGPSNEAIPPGQGFTGSLASPSFGFALARDSLATDTDDAADFRERAPSPRAPNAPFLALHSLHPAQDVDHLRLAFSGGDLGCVLATAEREAPHSELDRLDSLQLVVDHASPVPGDTGSTLLTMNFAAAESVVVRLGVEPGSIISTAVSWGSWVPWDHTTLLAVENLQAVQQNVDPVLDSVDVGWTNSSNYDSVVVAIDTSPPVVLPGSAQSYSTSLGAGHHLIQVFGRLDGFDGPRRETGVFVGPTACADTTGFEDGDSLSVLLTGFARVGVSHTGSFGLLDHPNPALTYPAADTAIALLDEPVDLTTASVVRFVHAAQLVDGDWGRVELSLDDGVNWLEIARYTGSDHDGSGGGANWTDLVLDPKDWVQESLDLSAWAGQRVRLRFRRVSAPTGGGGAGWVIDDVLFGSPLDRVIWVDPAGDDVFGCGHPERPLASFAAAAAVSAPGDTIHLAAGSYSESTEIMLDGSLRPVVAPLPPGRSLVGDGMGQTVLQVPALGTGVYAGGVTAWTSSDSGVVRDLSVERGSRGIRVDEGVVSIGGVGLDAAGTALLVQGGHCLVDGMLVLHAGRAVRQSGGHLLLDHVTIAELERAVFIEAGADSSEIAGSIFTLIDQTAIEVAAGAPLPRVHCNDFYGFSGSPEVFLGMPDPIGQDGNIAQPVLFCDRFTGDYHLVAGSPLLNLPGCGSLGALGEGCQNVAVGVPAVPAATRLLGNHPNPFNPRTRIEFETAGRGRVRLQVFDARGRRVRTLVDETLPEGRHHADWDGRDDRGRVVATGVYHARLSTQGVEISRPLVLLK